MDESSCQVSSESVSSVRKENNRNNINYSDNVNDIAS